MPLLQLAALEAVYLNHSCVDEERKSCMSSA